MMSKKKLGVIAGILVAIGGTLAGCGNQEAPKDAAKTDVITVGTNATYVPFEFKDDKNNQLQGFDIDMVNAIAKKIGAKVEFKNVAFDALIPSLNTNTIQLAASGMTITAERSKKVAFSSPYYESSMVALVKNDSPIKTIDQLEGEKIACQMATTGSDLAHTIKGAKIKEFDHNNEALLELTQGGVNAVVLDAPVAQYFISTKGKNGYRTIPFPNTKKYFGLAMNKDNQALKEKVDKAIAEMKADGELNKLYQKWFGKDAPEMPAQWSGK